MGGIGSGRQRQNPPMAKFLQLDVRQMQRQGALESGAIRSCQWTKEGIVLARAFLSIGASGLTIRYPSRQSWGQRCLHPIRKKRAGVHCSLGVSQVK
jgi:hypothetical protein